jgi:hypothetical protein
MLPYVQFGNKALIVGTFIARLNIQDKARKVKVQSEADMRQRRINRMITVVSISPAVLPFVLLGLNAAVKKLR